jgi:hypothetical protein
MATMARRARQAATVLLVLGVLAPHAGCSLADLSALSAGAAGDDAAATSTSAGGAPGVGSGPGGGDGGAPGTTTGGGAAGVTGVGGGAATTGAGGDGGVGGTGAGGAGAGGAGAGGAGAGGAGGDAAPCLEGQACSVVATFDGEGLDAEVWGDFGDCTRGAEQGGYFIDGVADGTAFCGEYTRGSYDITGNGVSIDVEPLGDDAGLVTFLVVEEGEGLPRVGIRKVDGTLEVERDGVMTNLGAFDPVAHRVWRIREADGEIVYEVRAAAAGAPWTELARETPPFDPTAVRLVFGVGTYLELPAPGRATFDCINVAPEECRR